MSLFSRLEALNKAYKRLRHRHIPPHGAAAEAAQKAATKRAVELEQLVAFGQALARAVDHDAIRVAIRHHLPAVAGTPALWVLLRHGGTWEALVGDTRRQEEIAEREDFCQRLLAGGPIMSASARMVGFPLIVGGSGVGVLGVQLENSPLTPNRQRMIAAASALLAVSLKHAQLCRDVRDLGLRDVLTGCATRATCDRDDRCRAPACAPQPDARFPDHVRSRSLQRGEPPLRRTRAAMPSWPLSDNG